MVKDRFSKMTHEQLLREVKRLTFPINSGRGLPARDIGGYSENSEKILRQLLRFLYDNLKEDYIAKIKMHESLTGEDEGKNDYYA